MKTQNVRITSSEMKVKYLMPQKSIGMAILFTFFLGPMGMLYSTVNGAIIMFFVTIVMLLFTAGLGLIITWPIGIVWAAIAARCHSETEL